MAGREERSHRQRDGLNICEAWRKDRQVLPGPEDGGPDVGNGIGGERRGSHCGLGEYSRLVWLFSGSVRRRGCFAFDPAVVTLPHLLCAGLSLAQVT